MSPPLVGSICDTSQKLCMSTNTICEHNIPDILFLCSFNLNSTCSAMGNRVSLRTVVLCVRSLHLWRERVL
jgi:hypothetical protein